jgi:ferric-dicitrate binding protein FerR (iron transport regulator)
LAFIFPSVVLSADPAIGTVTALRGTARLKRPGIGERLSVKMAMPFFVGDLVEAGSSSAVQLSLTDESFMNLAPGAAVRVNQYSFDPATDRRTMIIRVLEGRVRFVVFRLRKGGSSFRVQAANALVSTGGLGDLVVQVSGNQAEIAVLEHGLSVSNSLPYVIGNVNVGVNERTVVKEKEAPSVPKVISPQERKELLKDVKKI